MKILLFSPSSRFLQFPPGRFAQRHSLPSLPRLVVVTSKAEISWDPQRGFIWPLSFDRAEETKMADHSRFENVEVEQLRLESILGSLKLINEAHRILYVCL